ncbi:PGAP1-like alpha/beta domain-containing protein [Pseudomonas pseudonitroreducens]|uniref:PGAP1-like alpha/beta domain-containing protein n=1 Tax=Pseudomonas pseudonitroreducens TaxID=2892326 RepID=UPI001F30121F|nr:hypothetical protein [Pseudomonas pseudonitroreducens]
MPASPLHPFHPIIYVRGFAATAGEIEDTVSDPYMGFNIGSTRSRRSWTDETQRFYFESPLVRLMGEYQYDDLYFDGIDKLGVGNEAVPYRCVVIHRFYDEASSVFGSGETPPITHFAQGLNDLILALKRKVLDNPENLAAGVTAQNFRVNLVAHSMGGLVCRAFLQNASLGTQEARDAVEKLFTYATPHNGIDMRIVRNVPGWLTFGDVNNFNRERMADYLSLPKGTEDVSEVRGFPADWIFNLVGTNPKDYRVMAGASAWAAGDESDGLVRIENATTHGTDTDGKDVGSPRAFVHRSHSGYYGIVNSEEGFQNLTRFLFGKLRFDGVLDIDDITLPAEVDKQMKDGKQVRASYQFEVAVSIRGSQWQITRREVRENSAIFRSYEQLFPGNAGGVRPPDRSQSPHLFSVFLDPDKSVKTSKSVSFAFELRILVPDYEVDGVLFLKRHYEGSYILQKQILVEAVRDPASPVGWSLKYGFQENNPGKPGIAANSKVIAGGIGFDIPIEQKVRPGVTGTLRIEARPWNSTARGSN